uniref:Uncharacterized protein n=1 Tax=Panagrolaimus superbus TaxID=310955 RepID=A0A914YTJ7_9BILA
MDFGITQYLVIDQGTFIDDDGFSFDPISKSCMSFTESWPNPYIIKHNYCCTNYTYITIPENDPNPCTELKGTTMFVDTYDNIATLLTTTFGITASGLNVTLTTNMLQSPMTISKIFPNYVNYDCESSMKSSCNFMLKRGLARNSLYNMFMGGTTADDINNGYFPSVKIIKRNGMYLKNDNQLFTPNIPCSSVTTPFINGIKTLNTLCCSKFQESAKEMNTRKVFHSKKRNLLRIQPKPFKRSKSL